jgi:hypothetical protein
MLKSLLRHWCMHITYFDQHWSSSGVSKIADKTAVFPPASSIFGIFPRLCAHVPLIVTRVAGTHVIKQAATGCYYIISYFSILLHYRIHYNSIIVSVLHATLLKFYFVL